MWNTNNLDEQIQVLLSKYPQLTIAETTPHKVRLCGIITVNRTALKYTLQKDYRVEILLPIADTELPQIKWLDGIKDKSYPHLYKDGTMCLETDTAIKFRFLDHFSLVEWMDEYVEPYFFTYEYYNRFGVYPFGERSHGLFGILEAYQEIFKEQDYYKACNLLTYAATQNYAGHVECPCGSGLRLRKCHGPLLFPYMIDAQKKTILQEDLKVIQKEAIVLEKQRRNSTKAKQ